MAPKSGILYVTMQPKPGLQESAFHDWYNNEHGPTRLRLEYFLNGFRYRANDLEGAQPSASKPEWMAVYDIEDMAELTKDSYLRLRDPPVKSQREVDTMAQITVDRKLYDFVEERHSDEYERVERVENEGRGNVMIAVFLSLHNGEDKKEQLDKWYREEHVQMLSKVPGWLRTRRFVTSSIDPKAAVEYLALHEYKPENGLGGPEFQTAISTPWAQDIMSKVVQEKRRRVYDLSYTFGPAPRYLSPNMTSWQSTDERTFLTKTISGFHGGSGAIESYIIKKDERLFYRLEGSPDPDAPLILLSNSILVDYKIWDGFVTSFFSHPPNRKYRILRYLTRGRHPVGGPRQVTLDVLAEDIITILDALRVKKAASVIGVSLGGATVLNTALEYPDRVASFISCDTSSKSPAGNSKTWGDRIVIAEREAATDASGHPIVGEELAEATVRRWFVKESYDGGDMEKTCNEVKEMVKTNSLVGFKESVNALFDYDLKEKMKTSNVRGLFVVGSGDGVLPGVMKEMASNYGSTGAGYEVVQGAGHLPMVEKPKEFAEIVTKFLG